MIFSNTSGFEGFNLSIQENINIQVEDTRIIKAEFLHKQSQWTQIALCKYKTIITTSHTHYKLHTIQK